MHRMRCVSIFLVIIRKSFLAKFGLTYWINVLPVSRWKKILSLLLFFYIFQNRDESSIFEKLESCKASYEDIQDQYDKNNIRIGKEKILNCLGSYDEKCDSCHRDKLEHRYEWCATPEYHFFIEDLIDREDDHEKWKYDEYIIEYSLIKVRISELNSEADTEYGDDEVESEYECLFRIIEEVYTLHKGISKKRCDTCRKEYESNEWKIQKIETHREKDRRIHTENVHTDELFQEI